MKLYITNQPKGNTKPNINRFNYMKALLLAMSLILIASCSDNKSNTSNTSDTTAPTVSSATTVSTNSIELAMSEPVSGVDGTDIAANAFVISIVPSDPSVSVPAVTEVDVSDTIITLTLSNPISTTIDSFKLAFTQSNPPSIVDNNNNPLASFMGDTSINIITPLLVSLVSTVSGPTKLDTIPFTVLFSEDITGFTATDIRASSGTIRDLTLAETPHLQTIGTAGVLGSGDDEFSYPRGIMQASNGNIYVVDTDNHRILVYDGSTNTRIAQFGSNGLTDGKFNTPRSIIQHSNGDIYVLDTGNHRIQVFDDTTHAYKSQFGSMGTENGEFNSPNAIMQHSNGNIYVLDTDNHRVQIFNGTTHEYISQFGSMGTGLSTDENVQFNTPRDIMQHSNGNIYVLDTSNHRVQVFNGTTHAYISQFGSMGTENSQFAFPGGITQISNGNIYISDTNNHRIQIFDGITHAYESQFGSMGTEDGQFNTPRDITQSSNGNIYVSDTSNHRIQIFSSLSGYTFEVTNPTAGNALTVSIPANIVISDDANMNANSASNVLSLDIDTTAPTVTSVATSTKTSTIILEASETLFEATNIPPADFVISGDDIIPTVTAVNIQDRTITLTLSNPVFTGIDTFALTFSPTDSSINITDLAGNSLAPFSDSPIDTPVGVSLTTDVTSPTTLSTIPFVVQFSENMTGFDASDITTSSGTVQNFAVADPHIKTITSGNSRDFFYPRGIKFDSQGNLYVTDPTNRRTVVFDGDGTYLREISIGDHPLGLALDSMDRIFVSIASPTHNVRIHQNDGTFIKKFGSLNCAAGRTDCIRFSFVEGSLAIDSNDNLYVVDNGNNRVQAFNIQVSDDNTVTATPLRQFGSSGTGDGQFSFPTGVAVDSTGKVYVSDGSANNIQVFNSDGTFFKKFGSEGTGNGQFDFPNDIEIGADGRIYVADTSNHRIQMFDNNLNHLATFTHVTPGTAFVGPRGIAIGANNNLYITEPSSNRVRIFSPTPTYTFDVVNPDNAETLTVGIPAAAAQSIASTTDNAASNVVSIEFP